MLCFFAAASFSLRAHCAVPHFLARILDSTGHCLPFRFIRLPYAPNKWPSCTDRAPREGGLALNLLNNANGCCLAGEAEEEVK